MIPPTVQFFTKYPSFLNDTGLVEFLCNSLRPIVDGRCKPGEIGGILQSELSSREAEASRSIKAIEMISDALPGVGIVAAVLGIINTMSNLEDPESVGYKVAAAFSGTFLGIFLAYGVGVPLGRLSPLNQGQEMLYYRIVERTVSGFATGLSPIMAVEIGRRSLDKQIQPTADELEEMQRCRQGRMSIRFFASNHVYITCKKNKRSSFGHGGAWKVAYADFVTGMMSLFLVLWILSQDEEVIIATTRFFRDPYKAGVPKSTPVEQKDARPGSMVDQIVGRSDTTMRNTDDTTSIDIDVFIELPKTGTNG